MLAATSWNAHAMLRAGSRYSTRLSRTSTSMSGGTGNVGSRLAAPSQPVAAVSVFTSVSSVPSNVSRSTPTSRPVSSWNARRNGLKPTFAARAVMNGAAAPQRLDARVAELELRPAPAPARVEVRELKLEAELASRPRP